MGLSCFTQAINSTMKALCIYIFLGAIAVNIGSNLASNTAEGIKAAQEARIERLCQVNASYCS